MAQYDLNKVTKAVLALRDARTQLKRTFEEEDAKLLSKANLLETVLLQHLLDNQAKSMATDHATFYTEETMRPSATDWPAVYDFIKEHDAFEMLERRITKAFVVKYVEDNAGALPPGVAIHRETVVRVRRSNKA